MHLLLHQSLRSSANHRIILGRNRSVSHASSLLEIIPPARASSKSLHLSNHMHPCCHSFVNTRYYASTSIYRQKSKLAYEWIVNGKVIPQSQEVKDDAIASSVHEDGKEVIVFLHGLLGNAKVWYRIRMYAFAHVLLPVVPLYCALYILSYHMKLQSFN